MISLGFQLKQKMLKERWLEWTLFGGKLKERPPTEQRKGCRTTSKKRVCKERCLDLKNC